MNELIQSVLIIGAILSGIAVVLGFVLSKIPFKGNYTIYYPFALLFFAGLILLLFATIIVERIDIMGAGLGGWGIACLFAAAVGFIVTTILDAYAQEA